MISAAPLSSSSRPDRAAEFARPVRRALPRHLDEAAAGFVQHRGGQRHLVPVKRGVAGDRRIAVAVQHPQHLALGLGAEARRGVVDLRQTARASPSRSRRIRPRRCPAPPPAAFRAPKNHGRCATPCRSRSSPERAMTSASAGPTSPPSGSRCLSPRSSFAHAGVGRAAEMDHRRLPETAGADRPRGAPRWCRS